MGSSMTAAFTGDMNNERIGTDNMPTVGRPPLDKPTNMAAMLAQIK